MIAVIADDITGAAEMAGIGLRYNLSVAVHTTVEAVDGIDLLVIATDTRSMSEAAAALEMERLTRGLMALRPDWIFKKTDSVLRGHIIPEIKAQQKVVGASRTILAAANPSLGRTIQDGIYYLHGEPVHQTAFAHDPEFAIYSPVVQEMLHTDAKTVSVKKNTEPLPATGIIVAEVRHGDDLIKWAEQVNANTFAAGAAGFFTALLEVKKIQGKAQTQKKIKKQGSWRVIVCGSTFDKNRELVKKIKQQGGPVSYMPQEVITGSGEAGFEQWCNEVLRLLQRYSEVIIAVEQAVVTAGAANAVVIRNKMAALVKRVFEQDDIGELMVEGGSTAWALFAETGFHSFTPVKELAPGVIQLQHRQPDISVILKPGSYDWPANQPLVAAI